MKFYNFFQEGSTVNQIVCAILINLPAFAYGTSIGWMSPMALLLQSENSPKIVPLTDVEISWMASVAYLVSIPAYFLMAYLGDTVGRKITLIFLSACTTVSWILMLVSLDIWAFIVARALVGFAMAGCFVTCPIYTKEISDDSIRGALGCLVTMFFTSGNLFIYIIGDILSYRTVLWICLSVPTFHLILFMAMPDSPSYLVKTNRIEDATRVLSWLRCRNETDLVILSEIESIKKEHKEDEDRPSNRLLLKTIVSDQFLLKAFIIALILTMARELCGAVPVINFAGEIFAIATKSNTFLLSPNKQAMLLGTVQVAGSLLASNVIERAGRKILLIITTLIAGLSMCTLASWFVAQSYDLNAPNWLPVVTLCICIFCDSSGLGPISVVISGEIFSFKFRGTVMAITMALASFADFNQLLFFKPLSICIGIHAAFYFFGIFCILTSIYVLLFVPETKARKLEDIYKDLGRNDKSLS